MTHPNKSDFIAEYVMARAMTIIGNFDLDDEADQAGALWERLYGVKPVKSSEPKLLNEGDEMGPYSPGSK